MKSPDQIKTVIDNFVAAYASVASKSDPADAAWFLAESIELLLESFATQGDITSGHSHSTNMYGTLFRITVNIIHANGMDKTWQYMYDPSLAPVQTSQSSTKDAFDRAMKGI